MIAAIHPYNYYTVWRGSPSDNRLRKYLKIKPDHSNPKCLFLGNVVQCNLMCTIMIMPWIK